MYRHPPYDCSTGGSPARVWWANCSMAVTDFAEIRRSAGDGTPWPVCGPIATVEGLNDMFVPLFCGGAMQDVNGLLLQVRGSLPTIATNWRRKWLQDIEPTNLGEFILSAPAAVFPQIQRLTGGFDFASFISSPRDVGSTNVFVSCMSICVLWIVITSLSRDFESFYRQTPSSRVRPVLRRGAF
jgi:hypothetical protein